MDQQFRLKWNNHCNTLLQVFGNLLKTETLVDCTIGADGQYLKAHKVVVSACSPYFQSLFTEHFDKHPIIILKDIKFTELQSMIDYMYEGEVNISQDQLPSFLKAAASIQLKGLTQNVNKQEGPPPPSMMDSKPMPQLSTPRGMLTNGQLTPSSMLNVELEEGQQRKKRKMEQPVLHHPPSSASSSPSLVPDLVVPNVILDVPGENNGNNAPGTPQGQNGASGNSENNGAGSGAGMKKEPSEYSGRSDDEEEDGMSHDGWDLSNDGLQDSNSTMSAGDRSGLGGGPHHGGTPGGNRSAGGGPPSALSVAGGGQPDMSNVDENNQVCQYCKECLQYDTEYILNHCKTCPEVARVERNDTYICYSCEYRAYHRGHMRYHILAKHIGSKEFSCPYCPNRMTSSASLKSHIKTHTGEKSYKCNYCKHTTARRYSLKLHISNKHGEEVAHDSREPLIRLNTNEILVI